MAPAKLTKAQSVTVTIVMLGGFIIYMSQLTMSPALPVVMQEFKITAETGQWLTSIFLLIAGIMVPVTAYLIGRFSSRQIYMFSMFSFLIGSALAAFSNGFPMLMAGRILQATGSGIIFPFLTVIVMLIFPKARRGFAMGIVGIVMGFAPAIGPSLSGWIVDIWGWRYVFVIVLPFTVVLIIMAFIKLENTGERYEVRLDRISVVLSTVGFSGILYGSSIAGNIGWSSPYVIGSIAVGAACVVFFVRRELKSDEPMLNFHILKNAKFAISTIISGIISSSLTVGAVIVPIYLQTVLGYSALDTGLLLIPGALSMVIISPISGKLFDRFGPRTLSIIGLWILTAGSIILSLLHTNSTFMYVCIGYTLRMLGVSMAGMPITTWGLNMLPNKLIAHGNAVINTMRQVGGALGIAILVTVMMMVSTGSGQPEAQATVMGVNAAFRGSLMLIVIALVLTILRVKGDGYAENN